MQETDTAVQAASQVEEGSKPRYRELEFGVRSIQVRESDDGGCYIRSEQDLLPHALRMTDRLLHWAQTTPEQVLSVLPALLTAAACGVFGTMAAALLCAKLLRIPISLAAAYGISCTFGFPTTMLIPQEVSEAFGRNEKEKKAILNFLLPKMLTAGFVTVTIVSVLIAGAAVKML